MLKLKILELKIFVISLPWLPSITLFKMPYLEQKQAKTLKSEICLE